MTLPTMAPEPLDRDGLIGWSRDVDAGPFSSLAVGERLAFPNLEIRAVLAAAAAVTERVKIVSTILVLPLHPAAWLAKELASLDLISGGRLVVGVGVGGREEDYRVAGVPFDRRHARMDAQVEVLRKTWDGAVPDGAARAVGPAPARMGGPPLWAAVRGKRPLARAASWAEGILDFSLGPEPAETANLFDRAVRAWADAGRGAPPWRATSFWYALGPDAESRLEAYARRYLAVFGEGAAAALAMRCRASGSGAVADRLRELRDAGADEVVLVPTTSARDELARTIDLLADLGMGGAG